MRMKVYHFLVNKHPGIHARYHRKHDGATGARKITSWIYLLALNFAFHVLRCRWLGKPMDIQNFESRNIPTEKCESSLYLQDVGEFVRKLEKYDVVSFDIFDTLIFRPFSDPTDLFFLIGCELNYMDFRRIRTQVENDARWEKFRKEESFEVTLEDIWKRMEKETGISAEKGMEVELQYELKYCYANPFMEKVFHELRNKGKRIVITSDMYLPQKFLIQMLEKNGYYGFEELFVSCEIGKCKGNGELFGYVKKQIGENLTYAHVGDNKKSDIEMAEKQGFKALYYPNVNRDTFLYRPYDISVIVGGAYRGLVHNRMHCGLGEYSQSYEYGYIYGGLFVLGYCNFIHDYCKKNNVDKVLFLARDGAIIQKAYKLLYPEDATEYVYWSRLVSSKLTAGYYKYDYLRKFLMHKINQNISLEKILHTMELDALIGKLPKSLKKTDKLTDQNIGEVKDFLSDNWNQVLAIYRPQREAAGIWYRNAVGDSKKVVAVDIGWAGSGAISLDCLFREEWKIPCEVIGMVAGTNTAFNCEPDMSESFLLKGNLVSYLYSQGHNRDLWKKHDPNRDYNIYWELLTSSSEPSFKGFYKKEGSTDIKLEFLKPEKNPEGIMEIQRGILDFVKDYQKHFEDVPYLMNISGRDAYAPMLVAASHNEAYLKDVNKGFGLEIGVGN